MEMQIELNARDVAALNKAVKQAGAQLNQQLAIVVNLTTKATMGITAKKMQAKVTAPQKLIKKQMEAGPSAKKNKIGRTFKVKHSKRIGLHETRPKPRQLKSKGGGVRYTASKEQGAQVIKDGFQRPKMMGGQLVAVRVGPKSYPLRFPKGPSPWGVFLVNHMMKPVRKDAQKRLAQEVKRRSRAVLFKAGLIT